MGRIDSNRHSLIQHFNKTTPDERKMTLANQLAIKLVELADPQVQASVLYLLDHYSRHEMGSGQPLPEDVRSRVIDGLQAHPMSRIFIAYAGDQPIAMAICFVGFSTFKARKLINIHDLVVHESERGRGVGSQLIDAVIAYAKSNDCCAITLEVRADNPARTLYHKKGFQSLGEPLASDVTLFGKLILKA